MNHLILFLLFLGVISSSLFSQQPVDQKKPSTFPIEIKSSSPKKPKLMSLVVKVEGTGVRYLTDQIGMTLKEGRLIPTKGMFIVPQESKVVFRPMPGITTLITENSKVQMKGLQIVKYRDKVAKRRAFLYLNEGQIFSSILKGNEKTITYEIQTPQGVVAAKGTRFWVSYRDGIGKVGVLNGIVSVRLTNQSTLTLKQGDFVDLQGIGETLKAGDIRAASPQESEMNESFIQSVSQAEGSTPRGASPFAVDAENALILATPGGSVLPGGAPSSPTVGAAGAGGATPGASLTESTSTPPNIETPANTNNTPETPPVSPVVP